MRIKILIATTLIMPILALSQPPKKKPITPTNQPTNLNIVADTLTDKCDTVKVQFRVWMNGEGYESYLARVNGYVLQKYKVGKYTSTQPALIYYDAKWKELRPEDLELQLTKQLK